MDSQVDYASLSKEELVRLINSERSETTTSNVSKEPSSSEPVQPTFTCGYKPVRSGQKPCEGSEVNEFGFCKRHSTTVQGRKAKKAYLEQTTQNAQTTQTTQTVDIAATAEPTRNESTTTNTPNVEIAEEPIKTAVISPEIVEVENTPQSDLQADEVIEPVVEIDPPANKTSKKKKEPVQFTKVERKKKTIRPNYWGRYEDPDTRIVFDPTTSKAYGVQDPSGKVFALGDRHIEICKLKGWGYHIPEEFSDDEDEDEDSNEDSEEYESDSGEYTESSFDEFLKDQEDEQDEELNSKKNEQEQDDETDSEEYSSEGESDESDSGEYESDESNSSSGSYESEYDDEDGTGESYESSSSSGE